MGKGDRFVIGSFNPLREELAESESLRARAEAALAERRSELREYRAELEDVKDQLGRKHAQVSGLAAERDAVLALLQQARDLLRDRPNLSSAGTTWLLRMDVLLAAIDGLASVPDTPKGDR